MEHTEQLIEAYCNNQLSPEEIQEFEVELKSNKDLQKEVREMLITLGAFKDIKAKKLRERLTSIEKRKVRQLNPVITWIRYAAAIVLIAVAGYFVFDQINETSPQNIYLSYMEPYPNVIDPGTRGDVGTQSIEALKLYDQGDYEGALSSFDEYLNLNPEDIETRFYYGVTALMNNEFEIADKELQTVANSNSRLANQATWYLALTRINTDKIDLAKENLNTLIEGQSSYAQRAEEIMKKL